MRRLPKSIKKVTKENFIEIMEKKDDIKVINNERIKNWIVNNEKKATKRVTQW